MSPLKSEQPVELENDRLAAEKAELNLDVCRIYSSLSLSQNARVADHSTDGTDKKCIAVRCHR